MPSLAERVTAAAEGTTSLLVARAAMVGLRPREARALEYGCGIGVTTAALADTFGTAVGIDPSPANLEDARIINGDRTNVTFVAGDVTAIAAQRGTFDFAYADLRRARGDTNAAAVATALLMKLAPRGILAIRLPRPRGLQRVVAVPPPTRVTWRAVAAAIAASGGCIAWAGIDDDGSVLLYAATRQPPLRLVH